uniref:PAP/OAS1 substrate-binding-related domain-containing protein n=1 Tax=Lotharella oceanica TaxID=641309 RepID=A0A7S2X5V6_9EUKA
MDRHPALHSEPIRRYSRPSAGFGSENEHIQKAEWGFSEEANIRRGFPVRLQEALYPSKGLGGTRMIGRQQRRSEINIRFSGAGMGNSVGNSVGKQQMPSHKDRQQQNSLEPQSPVHVLFRQSPSFCAIGGRNNALEGTGSGNLKSRSPSYSQSRNSARKKTITPPPGDLSRMLESCSLRELSSVYSAPPVFSELKRTSPTGSERFSSFRELDSMSKTFSAEGMEPPCALTKPSTSRAAIPSFASLPSLAGTPRGRDLSDNRLKDGNNKFVIIAESLRQRDSRGSKAILSEEDERAVLRLLNNPRVTAKGKLLLSTVTPTAHSENIRSNVVRCIHELIKRHSRGQGHRSRNGNVQVYSHGSFASKTYLPCATVDVAAYFVTKFDKKRGEYKKNFWAQQVAQALAQNDRQYASVSGSVQTVRNVSVSQDLIFDTQVLQCTVEGVGVRVCLNRVDVLESLTLLETVDLLVGNNHLVKRTLLLVKAWAKYEAEILRPDMLSGYALQRVVLTVFNGFYQEIKTPIQGFFKTLSYLESFDWQWHAMGLYGPIQLSSLPKSVLVEKSRCAFPKDRPPLINRATVSKYSSAIQKVEMKKRPDGNSFPLSAFNVIETTGGKAFSNITMDITREKADMIIGKIFHATSEIRISILRNEDEKKAVPISIPESALKTLREVFKSVEIKCSHDRQSNPSGNASGNRIRSHSVPLDENIKSIGAPTWSWREHKKVVPVSGRMRVTMGTPYPRTLDVENNMRSDPLSTSMESIQQSLAHAKQFQSPMNITETQLVAVIAVVLDQHGKLPIGALGRMIRTAINSFSLPQVIQDCGGIKAFLMRHNYVFVLGENHPNNPLVHLNKSGFKSGFNCNGEISSDPSIMAMVNKVVAQTGGTIPVRNTLGSHKKKGGGLVHCSPRSQGGGKTYGMQYQQHGAPTNGKRWHGGRRGRRVGKPPHPGTRVWSLAPGGRAGGP